MKVNRSYSEIKDKLVRISMSNSKMKPVKLKKLDATEHYKKRKKKVDPEERNNEFDDGKDGILPGVSQSIAKSRKMFLVLSLTIISGRVVVANHFLALNASLGGAIKNGKYKILTLKY